MLWVPARMMLVSLESVGCPWKCLEIDFLCIQVGFILPGTIGLRCQVAPLHNQ